MAEIARIDPPIAAPENDPRVEFVLDACEGQPPVRKKRLIVRAALAGIIEGRDAEILIDALNLRAV